MHYKWLTGIIGLFTLVSCSKKIVPLQPVAQLQAIVDTIPLSEIDIPLQINLKPFYNLAEKSVQRYYQSPGWPTEYEVDNCDTRYMYRFKRGPLKITARHNLINMGFTGSYVIAGGQRYCTGTGSNRTALTPWSPTCTCGINEPERRVEIGLTAGLTLKNDYRVNLNLNALKPVPLDKCTVCAWNYDITTVVMDQLALQIEEAVQEIKDSIHQLSFRPQFQEIWNFLNTSVSVYDMGYLTINPEKLRISQLKAENDVLYLSVGISARPHISLSKKQTYQTLVPDISNFDSRKGFNLYVDAALDYDSLSAIINKQLGRQRIDLDGNKHIIIEECRLYDAVKEKLIIQVKFSGSARGELFLTGKPWFNKPENRIEIKELDYDINTKSLLLKTAKWLFSKRILNELNKYSRFDLNTYSASLLYQVNKQMNSPWNASIQTSGYVSKFEVMELLPRNNELFVRCNVSGELHLRTEDASTFLQ